MFNKNYSGLKICWHQDKLRDLQNGVVSAPLYVRIKPTNKCNQKCFYCSYADVDLNLRQRVKKQDELEWDILRCALKEFVELDVKAVTFSGGGEPLLYPHIKDAFSFVCEAGIDLSLITNGILLQEEIAEKLTCAKWVRISADSSIAERYAANRGVASEQFRILSNNIRHFSRIKSQDCELGINFVVNHGNKDEIYQAAQYYRDCGVNHIKFTARVMNDTDTYHASFKERVIALIAKAQQELETDSFKVINKYATDFDLSLKEQRQYNKCYIMQILSVIGADANAYMCHDKAYVPNGVLGNLKEQSFRNIWFSSKVRNIFELYNPQKECCHHCVFDERNLLISNILKSDGNHVNFI